MNALLALTIEIPDWLFDGRFWCGFGAGVASFFLLLFILVEGFIGDNDTGEW